MKTDEDRLGYKPEVRKIQAAKQEVNDISSRLLDWMRIEGKTTEVGAGVNVCEAVDPDLERYYTIRHPWSVYDLRKGTFEEAMQNLREQLPRNGWKIIKDDVTNSSAQNPEISAVNSESHHVISIEWARKRSGGLKQIISVDIDSRCYRAPKGTDIYSEK
ncbi:MULTISPECIES: hypothetical protein [unclassified Streptomyces]|uniref:hypothetical protein n=1 Tax=unclassified Streptomyces TaxID=2593676 RepID=UPI0037F82C26